MTENYFFHHSIFLDHGHIKCKGKISGFSREILEAKNESGFDFFASIMGLHE